MKHTGRVAIFLSGRGSNFEAIYRSSMKVNSPFKIVVVISDKKHAPGLKKAREYGIPSFYVSPKRPKSKEQYEREILQILREKEAELICLAGYMRIVGTELLKDYENRILNIHPALLPSFPGLDAQKQALDYGVKITGCTVHFVDPGVDTGPIILQKAVEVKEDDTEEDLAQRILEQEHLAYSEAIEFYFTNRLKIKDRKVIISL
jgi:phosphoribosylglycinamide formyltransferase-1